MTTIQSEPNAENAERERLDNGSGEGGERRLFFRVMGILLPLAVLLAAGVVATWLIDTSPQAKPRPPEPTAALVEVIPVSYSPQRAVIQAMGEVIPARQIDLKPQVSGEVIAISENLLPGGLFRSGQTILKIDPADYELAVSQLSSEVVQAESDLEVERGSQSIARNEFELLAREVSEEDLDLVLRRPQLKSVRAALTLTHAKLEKAKLDLERTTIKAPFNAIVKSRDVNIGARVTDSTLLVNLVGTDAYWVEVSVATNQLQWIHIPRRDSEKGSLVRVYDTALWGDGVYRSGRVIRLAADLEEQGRMARLIVSVEDPLSLEPADAEKPRLLLGSYVRCEIEGIQLASVAALGRGLIRDGNTVWIMDSEDKLDIRPVEIAFRGRDRVMISGGIRAGERLVVSRLATPVQGMALRIRTDGRGGADQSLISGTAVGEGRP
jgi:RND family efflux transporter MFP subunit